MRQLRADPEYLEKERYASTCLSMQNAERPKTDEEKAAKVRAYKREYARRKRAEAKQSKIDKGIE